MAKRIEWTRFAQRERKEILSYWVRRNKSTAYSKKLDEIFRGWVLFLSKRPLLGRKTDVENVRVKIVKD